MAARGEFLRLHPRLIGELRLPESSSGLWQRVGLSLSRNKGVIFGSVVSAKEVQSGGCGLGLVWYSVFLLVQRSSLSEEVCLICLTAPLVWWVKRVYSGRVGGGNLQVNFPNDGTAYHWTPPRAAGEAMLNGFEAP